MNRVRLKDEDHKYDPALITTFNQTASTCVCVLIFHTESSVKPTLLGFVKSCLTAETVFPSQLICDSEPRSVGASAMVSGCQPRWWNDFEWLSSERLFHKWIRITCVGSDADCIRFKLLWFTARCCSQNLTNIFVPRHIFYILICFYTLPDPLECASITW